MDSHECLIRARQGQPGVWTVCGVNIVWRNEIPNSDPLLPVRAWLDALTGPGTSISVVLRTFESEETTLRRLRAESEWVIRPGHDGYYLEAWSLAQDAALTVQSCCKAAEETLRKLPWISENIERLVWDEDYLCFSLPELVRVALHTRR